MISRRENAIKRINLLKRHFVPSEDFKREFDTSSFDFELAYKAIRGLRPEVHHQIIQLVDSMMKGNQYKERSREKIRYKTNYCLKKIMAAIYKKGLLTPEQVIENPDLLNR